jgi:hypothetical protein
MPSGQDGLFGQLFCCTSRVRTSDGGKSLDGAGVFPFVEGKSSTIPGLSFDATKGSLSCSRDGSQICFADSTFLSLVRFSPGATAETDVCGLVSQLKVSDGDLLAFVHIVDSLGPDQATVFAFSPTRLHIAIMGPIASSTFVDVPPEYGSITCASAFVARQWGNIACITGTDKGYILLWSGAGSISPINLMCSSGLISICCDSYHIFAGIKDTNRIEIFSLSSGNQLVDSVEVPSEFFGLIGPCLMRPISRVIDRRPSSPYQSPKSAKPVGSLFAVNATGNWIAHINLELKQSACEFVKQGAPVQQLLFGPFDNGPVLTAGASQLAAWEAGAFLRMSSRMELAFQAVAVSPARDKPRLWLLTIEQGITKLTSLGLRTGHPVKDDRIGCF